MQLAKVSTVGTHFRLGGGALSTNDYFIGKARLEREEEIKKLKNKKEESMLYQGLNDEANMLLEKYKVGNSGVHKVSVADLKKLLHWKLFGTDIKIKGNKKDFVTLWDNNKRTQSTPPSPWTALDELNLLSLQQTQMTLHDTLLAKQHAQAANTVIGGIWSGTLDKETLKRMKEEVQKALDDSNQDRD